MSSALRSFHEELLVPVSVFVHAIGFLGLFRVQGIENASSTCWSKQNLLTYRIKGSMSAFRDSLIKARSDQKEQFDSPLHRLAFLMSVFASSWNPPTHLPHGNKMARGPYRLQSQWTPRVSSQKSHFLLRHLVSFFAQSVCSEHCLCSLYPDVTHWLHPGMLG